MFKGGMGNLMKQAQEMQEKMQQAQEEIAQMEVLGEAGAGMIKVTMNGRHDVSRVEIDPSVMQEDKELLEDLLAAAVNDASRKVETQSKARMEEVSSGLNLTATDFLPKMVNIPSLSLVSLPPDSAAASLACCPLVVLLFAILFA